MIFVQREFLQDVDFVLENDLQYDVLAVKAVLVVKRGSSSLLSIKKKLLT